MSIHNLLKKQTTRQTNPYNGVVVLITLFCITLCNAQIKQPKTPTFNSFKTQTINPNNNLPFIVNRKGGATSSIKVNNSSFKPNNSIDGLYNELKSLSKNEKVISYELPKYTGDKVDYYKTAFEKLKAMEDTDYSIAEATFTIENAFYEETKNYQEFKQTIKNIGGFLNQKMNDFGYNNESNFAKNIIIFQFFSDTLQVNKNTKHFPLEYDFNDYMGDKDWSKMFVSKLLETNKGQCNSMPRLYMLLAEEIGAEAYLSLSPNHSFIKFPDDRGNWINVELTSKVFPSNALIMQFGYINTVALQKKVYMQPLSKKELLAQSMIDLASGYVQKFGYDSFVNTILEEALKFHPNNMTGIQLQSNYYTILSEYVMKQFGISEANFQEIKKYPKALELYKKRLAQYDLEDSLGYAPMPKEMYQQWLNTIDKHQSEQEKNNLLETFKIKAKTILD